ncbi:LON peptidase N-terminal domain and RING finger protein 3-like isoform X2 [Macadamia integrifolia]|uniref:LON peptidase N-terminal domain and RING finger protein 3-like isoform X2 n=1 Tax=Macadamia integrifolia TaxID=60698 RepID=UPI001C4FF669|nr:LON peptidase N-terminal domain and RING finger protein 3-like isoform X2 [Macadamia integrifolia]
MAREEKNSPQIRNGPTKRSATVEDGGDADNVFSPGFRSVAAMAGWDEEAILLATQVVEDTPDRESKEKKRAHLQFKSPRTSSRRQTTTTTSTLSQSKKRSTGSIPIGVLNLDDEETAGEEHTKKTMELKTDVIEEKKEKEGGVALPVEASDSSCSGSALPCMDRLREELSCAICLEICFEPSTTPCGHSFCKKCLKSAADKCGKKCPKCRQLVSNGRSCTVNTVLWNTIQLLFPQEVEARKAAGALNNREMARQSPKRGSHDSRYIAVSSRRESRDRDVSARRIREVPSQVEDAALAFRLQREEFMGAFRETTHGQPRNSLASARANLRALASRAMASPSAINFRIRNQRM